MTTYLATTNTGENNDAFTERTAAYCSDQCRMDGIYAFHRQSGIKAKSTRDDDRYEFDETCVTCGRVVEASKCFDCGGSWNNDDHLFLATDSPCAKVRELARL